MPRALNLPGASVLARYLRCVSGGQAAGTGVPDGDSRLSIVRNFKFINTLKPNANGFLDIYLSVSAQGVIHQLAGLQDATVIYPSSISAPSGFLPQPLTISNRLIANPILPSVSTPVNPASMAPFRVVNAVHKLEFTGPTLYNGGTFVANPVTATIDPDTVATSGQPRDVSVVQGLTIPVNSSTTLAGAAKSSFTIVQLPRNTEYFDEPALSVGYGSSSATAPFIPNDGNTGYLYGGATPHPSLRIYRVRYQGLSTEASITVTSEVCVQYLVNLTSTEATLARPSEFTDSNMLQNFLGAMGSSPLMKLGADAAKLMIRNTLKTRAPMLLPLMDAVV